MTALMVMVIVATMIPRAKKKILILTLKILTMTVEVSLKT